MFKSVSKVSWYYYLLILLVGWWLSIYLLSLFQLLTTSAVRYTSVVWTLLLLNTYVRSREDLVIPKLVARISALRTSSWQIKSSVFLYVLLFLQGFFSAPNTSDSMTYHFPRFLHWLGNRTVFQTSVFTINDFLAPFADYVQLIFYSLTSSDRLIFAIQWCSAVCSHNR